jgi:RNA polymerase sigma-70 factor (ECF subfamily)
MEHGLQAEADILDDCDGESVLLLKERHRILEAAIRALEPERQRVLVMNRIHGLSFAEISRRTGISQTQVKRLAADAIARCNEALRRALPDGKD